MRELLITLVLLGLFSCSLAERQKRIGIFEVVKFANDQCAGNNGKNGTCFTEDECESRNGAASGECAEGYGVCCVFSLECGGMRKENCTYFESTNGQMGPCAAEICKMSSDIAQIRLDFDKFVLNGPSTATASTFKALAGVQNAGGAEATQATNCMTDQFAVTAPGSHGSPVICGTNTGEHMYVDASDNCNKIVFNIGSSTAEWSIKVMQYSMDFSNKAPSGCLQYFFGAATGTVQSFNRAGADRHLADQNQLICVRREANMCRICWAADGGTDFAVSGMSPTTAATGKFGKSNVCGAYGMDGMGTDYDFVRIPSATKEASVGSGVSLGHSNFCGHALVSATGGTAATICSKALPFHIRFVSDGYEAAAEAAVDELGFKLVYEQSTC